MRAIARAGQVRKAAFSWRPFSFLVLKKRPDIGAAPATGLARKKAPAWDVWLGPTF